MSDKKKKILTFDQHQVNFPKADEDVFNLATFNKNFDIKIVKKDAESIELQLIGLDSSVANALRRIIIAQVPTMAFHKVLLYQNTSVMPDQLLIHRLGLLPLKADPNMFQQRRQDQELGPQNSLKFELKVKCTKKKQYANVSDEQLENRGIPPEKYLNNAVVYSNQIKWIPLGNLAEKITQEVKLVHQNIVVAKLRENQQINLEIYAEKGIGKRHTKWSPVATAFYRLMPQISILPDFNHENHAESVSSVCPASVFTLKKGKLVVSQPRQCTTCRQCVKVSGIQLGKVADHFIFTIESTGIFNPEQIFIKALDILEEKAKTYVI